MATPRIDVHAFIGWRGRLHAGVRRIARLPPRTGISGEAKVMDAWGTVPESIVTSREWATQPEAEQALEDYRALMDGSTVPVIDPLGRSWSVKVDSVVGDISETGRKTYRLVATWKLQVEAGP